MSREKPRLPSDPSPSPLPATTSTHSFWHSEPSPLLTAHRSTRNLPEKADVVIIGSGMTGASVAHHLLNDQRHVGDGDESLPGKQNRGLNVVMLEAREACWGATGRNGGHCQPLLLEHPSDPSIPAFELSNFHALHSLVMQKQIPCEFVPQPGVRAMYSLSNLHAMELALHTLQFTAPEMAKMTRITRDEDELAQLRVPGAFGAVITDVAARMWPYKFVARILEDLLTATSLPGGSFNLQTLTPVTGLARTSSGSHSGWLVQTDRGSVTTPKVVLATNAYTSHLLPTLADLIVPVRGQMSALQPLTSVCGPNRLRTSFGFAGDGIDDYLIQRPNESGGHLMFGGGRQCLPCVGETDDSALDAETAKYLRRRLVDALALPEGRKAANGTARRNVLACDYCRRRRIHCSGPTPLPVNSGDNRCSNCVRFRQPCGSFTGPSNPKPDRLEFKASHEWTGIMGFSRDDLPWVGEVPASLLPNTAAEEDPYATSLMPGLLRTEGSKSAFKKPITHAETEREDETGLFIAAGYTGHGMPNTWLCGAAVAHMVSSCAFCSLWTAASASEPGLNLEDSNVDCLSRAELAVEATGLPTAYLISEERVARAREVEDVHARDWAEMDRGARSAKADRPHSGYA